MLELAARTVIYLLFSLPGAGDALYKVTLMDWLMGSLFPHRHLSQPSQLLTSPAYEDQQKILTIHPHPLLELKLIIRSNGKNVISMLFIMSQEDNSTIGILLT